MRFEALDPETVVVGVPTSALGEPVAKQADGDYSGALGFSYEAEGDCAIDGSRVISFTDATECVITVVANPATRGEASFSKDFAFTPGMGSFQLTWGGYASGANTATFGDDAVAADAPVTTPNCIFKLSP